MRVVRWSVAMWAVSALAAAGCGDSPAEPAETPDPTGAAALQVRSLDLWPGNLLTGQTADAEGVIANASQSAAGRFTWRILVDDAVAASGQVAGLAPGETVREEVRARGLGPFERGLYEVALEIEPSEPGDGDPEGLRRARRFQVFEPGFGIDLRILSDVTPAQEEAFLAARARWEELLPGDLEPTRVVLAENECGRTHPAVDEEVDDLLILVVVKDMGPGVLARAGPCVVRERNLLPAMGTIHLDPAPMAHWEGLGILEDVILHEIGHILGIGPAVWQELLVGAGGPDPHFVGPQALRAYQGMGLPHFGGSIVPVENEGGPGTRDAHWRWRVFTDHQSSELMTSIFRDHNPLTALTLGALEDIGWAVNLALTDSYILPAPADPASSPVLLDIGDDLLRAPVRVVAPDGRTATVLDPWRAPR